jgi:hypothetical protein
MQPINYEELIKDCTNQGFRVLDECAVALRQLLDDIKTLDSIAAAEINRRVPVEQYLLDVYHGKHPLPDKDKCLELARQLGVDNAR